MRAGNVSTVCEQSHVFPQRNVVLQFLDICKYDDIWKHLLKAPHFVAVKQKTDLMSSKRIKNRKAQ